ncbi:hypothetical protein [uncultured Methanomethylovorans sp.]|uniref:hypothetical protein n=1 Tax=uncultured Methanomethylovorans sp. TaxID=183759 RepID=UPI002AA6365E|nr:hypothetical protein [uncultured Methanomethylovorans sp.]
MTDIEVRRGYQVLSDNTLQFGIKISNNGPDAILDVEVILFLPESLFKLQGDRIQKLGNILPNVSRTAKFVMKPMSCVHK